MAKPPPVSHRFWCPWCNIEDEDDRCQECGRPKDDLGYRVGWNPATYVWYSTPPKL